jgi:hypothetical protein
VIRRAVEVEEGPGEPPKEMPDDFYELTRLDALMMSKRSSAEPILMTKKMREAAAARDGKKHVPTHAAIRFALPPPSDLVIEVSFLASDKVSTLYAFIDRCARDGSALELFVTPPKRSFVRHDVRTTLLEAGLAPAARVRIGIKGVTAAFASARDAEALLREEFVALAAKPAAPTVRVVERVRQDENTMETTTDATVSVPVLQTAEEKKRALADKLASGGAPKWLKFGKK